MPGLRTLAPLVAPLDMDTAKPPAKLTEKLYSSTAWLGLMARLRKQRGNRCEHCNATKVRTVGDHIVELKDGGAALDAANVQLLCWPCHTTKTNKARSVRLARPLGG
jgi:5-methylcytosine-specific restriction endonuclease McrA